jgi:hypothetical protein
MSASLEGRCCGSWPDLARQFTRRFLVRANRPYQREVGSRMTDIDPKSDIELHTVNEHVIARVPLAGPVSDEWLRCYQRLARAAEVPV